MARSSTFTGDILHCAATRMRVTGTGVLRQELHSLDDINNVTLPVINMASATNREALTLANFLDQRVQLEIKTTGFGERFNISRVIIYVKPTYSGYPQ